MEPSDEVSYPEGQHGLRARAMPDGRGCLFEIVDRRDRALAQVALEVPEGSVRNLGRYAASWIAGWPKRPSSTAALT